jgi:hypothetical protein
MEEEAYCNCSDIKVEALQCHHWPAHFIYFTLNVICVLKKLLHYFLVILMYKYILIYLETFLTDLRNVQIHYRGKQQCRHTLREATHSV